MNDNVDVLVAGAGPVGLVLAAELRLAGIEPVVIERETEPLPERRARGLGPLAAEVLRRRGLGPRIAPFHEAAQAQLELEHGSPNQHFAWINKITADPDRGVSLIWQPDLVRVLGEYADELGITVHRGHELVALDQDGDRVRATIRTPDGETTISARYLVGCDGGRSAVRGLAGFEFPGTEPTMITRAARADIADPSGLPPSGRIPTGAVFYGHGMVGAFEFAGAGTADLLDGPVADGAAIEASIHRLTGVRVELTEASGFLRATDNARQASTYRIGRVLLAGDAAHVHSPNGGQGLTLGVVDAANLGWKLAATVLGTAPEGLLDTYTAERHPVAAAVLHNTIAQTALLRPGPHVDALRDIVSDLMDIPEVSRYFGRMVNGFNTRYDLGYQPAEEHPLLSTLSPDLRLRTGGGPATLSEFTTGGGAVLLWPDLPVPVAAAGITVVPVTWIERDLGAALVRPDGMLAWCTTDGAAPDDSTLNAALARWFGTASEQEKRVGRPVPAGTPHAWR